MVTEKQQIAIDDIMDNFDFHQVHNVMKFLNLRWINKDVPSISDLKQTARRLLKDSISQNTDVSTGGFLASYENDADCGLVLSLKFIFFEYDSFIEDDSNEYGMIT